MYWWDYHLSISRYNNKNDNGEKIAIDNDKGGMKNDDKRRDS
jgi:hypothetical protein